MAMPVLSTKLYIPEIRENRVVRSTLVEKMALGIRKDTKLTLVSAPAGYGKTTLVLELLRSLPYRSTWISLDESDNELSQFLSYCIAALKKAGVPIGPETEKLAVDLKLSSTQAPMTLILNDIMASSEKILLVLDDFHLIHAPQVHHVVKFLLEYQPPNFHLIVITRQDPNLPLSQLRVQGKVTEVRMKDLCFTAEEAETFLKGVMGLELSPDVIKTVAYRTEGWAAGLQLVGLSLNRCEEQEVAEFIRVFQDTHRYIIDYLVEEVINRQTHEIRDFLCKTSILDRMNGALCDEIMGIGHSRQLLQELEKANLFLIPLDSKREWYRYHHLFADSLRAELTEAEEQEMQRKAALWFWDNGFKQEAVSHALKSGDMLLSVKLMEGSTEDSFRNAQLSTLVNWMNAVPEPLIRGNEILSVRKAWALYLIGRASEAVQYMDTLGEDFFEKTTVHNQGLLLSLKASMAQQRGCGDPEGMAGEALRLLEPWDPIARISTMNTLGKAQEANGRITEANGTFRMAYKEALNLGYSYITTLALKYLGTSLNTMGKCGEAMDLYTLYIERMMNEFGKVLPFIGVIYMGLAELWYDRNELEKAKDYMDKGMELCRSISYGWAPYVELMNARIKYAMGEREAAIRSAEGTLAAARRENMAALTISSMALLTELWIREGKTGRAEEFDESLKSQTGNMGKGASEEASLAYARLLIHRQAGKAARELLTALEMKTAESQKVREQIIVYVLYAEACYCDGDDENTAIYMDKAVKLAEPQGYYRLFLEDQEIMKGILLHSKKEKGQFLQKLEVYLKLPVSEEKTSAVEDREALSPPTEDLCQLEYIESLSKREIEILNLIAAGMSNNEIAKTLYISTNTTQWHISHIYSKLGTKNRTQAVRKARELRIIL